MALLAYGSAGLAGQNLPLSIHDSFRLYPGQYEKAWGVDAEEFTGKLGRLTRFQMACLELWGASFWQGDYLAVGAVDEHCATLE